MTRPPSGLLDLRSILRELTRHEVDFVLVGGLAGMAHGSSYPSYDVDVAYERGRDNLARLVEALRELGATLRVGGEGSDAAELPFQLDVRTLENGANFTFSTPFGPLDVLGDPGGIRSYAELKQASERLKIEGVEIDVASIDHLIAMKRAANRPKDRLMLEEYIALADSEGLNRSAGG